MLGSLTSRALAHSVQANLDPDNGLLYRRLHRQIVAQMPINLCWKATNMPQVLCQANAVPR